MQEVIVTTLTIFLPLLLGWFFGKRKNNAETKGIEISNELSLQEARLKQKSDEMKIMSENASYYQQMVDDFAERYKQVLADLKEANDASKERDIKIDELLKAAKDREAKIDELLQKIKKQDAQIQELIDELRKYKQLNGKSQ